jgi:hypothetical protein
VASARVTETVLMRIKGARVSVAAIRLQERFHISKPPFEVRAF